jgi:antirestriction protein
MNCIKEKIEINEDNPQIYIACLSAYNNGYLHGDWIDASQGIDHVRDCIKEILSSSPVAEECEEWAIHDFQGFGNYKVNEYHDLEKLCEVAEFLSESESRFPSEVVSWLIDDYGIDGAREKMEDDYIGEFDSDLDLAYHYVEELCLLDGVCKTVSMYFDYASFGRDLDLNGDVISFSGHYFWNR